MKKIAAVAALAVVAIPCASIADKPASQSKAGAAQKVHLTGCPAEGVEGSCLMLMSKGKTYDISAAPAQADPGNPGQPPARPRTGYLGITLEGVVDSGAVTTCMQGMVVKDIKWSYTREKCDKAKPAMAAAPGKGPSCTWSANHDFMPPQPARLSVTGTCEMPTPGYKLTLSKVTPPGINPEILLLKFNVQPPSGIVSQVITKTPVSPYEEKTNKHYKSATIQPMGDSVPVKETN